MPEATPAPIVPVAAGILWRGAHLLACQRPANKPHGGFWEFPGGKIATGENAAQALVRELLEELGIAASQCDEFACLRHSYQARAMRVELHFFDVWHWQGELQPKEGQLLRWIKPPDALTLPFLPADLAIVEALAARAAQK